MKRLYRSSLRPVSYCSLLLALAWLNVGCGPDQAQMSYVANWSPDGSRIALAVSDGEKSPGRTGIWILDARTGESHQIVSSSDETLCVHPKWAPSGEQLLFAILEHSEGENHKQDDWDLMSIWTAQSDGSALRKVVSVPISKDPDGLALPNAIAWGRIPGTIVFQTAVDEKVTALELDLHTGFIRPFLPAPSSMYSLEFSPSREQAAALLMKTDEDLADVYVSDSVTLNWRRLGTLHYDRHGFDSFLTQIYWSPDSSKFVVPELEPGINPKAPARHYLRLFDVRSGASERLCSGEPNTQILWNPRADSILFSGSAHDDRTPENGMFRVDLGTRQVFPLVLDGENHAVSWDSRDGRIYFYRRYHQEGKEENDQTQRNRMAFYSCAENGTDVRALSEEISYEDLGWLLSPDRTRLLLNLDSPDMLLMDFHARTLAAIPFHGVLR